MPAALNKTSKHIIDATGDIAHNHSIIPGEDVKDEYKYFYSKEELKKLKNASSHCKACSAKYRQVFEN